MGVLTYYFANILPKLHEDGRSRARVGGGGVHPWCLDLGLVHTYRPCHPFFFNHFIVKACSHRAKAKEIKEKNSDIKQNFHFRVRFHAV